MIQDSIYSQNTYLQGINGKTTETTQEAPESQPIVNLANGAFFSQQQLFFDHVTLLQQTIRTYNQYLLPSIAIDFPLGEKERILTLFFNVWNEEEVDINKINMMSTHGCAFSKGTKGIEIYHLLTLRYMKKIQGVISYHFYTNNQKKCCSVDIVSIEEQYQNKKFGSILLACALDHARYNKCTEVLAIALPASYRLFSAYQFRCHDDKMTKEKWQQLDWEAKKQKIRECASCLKLDFADPGTVQMLRMKRLSVIKKGAH